jgi:hypothetical protein
VRDERVSQCGDEYLKCRQSLLPIDDFPYLDTAKGAAPLLQHDRAEKVRDNAASLDSVAGREDVLPQWLPLLVRRPDIWPLEERDGEPGIRTEDGPERARMGLHSPTLLYRKTAETARRVGQG